MESFDELLRASQEIRRNSQETARSLEGMRQTASQIMVDMERAKINRQEQLGQFHQYADSMQQTLNDMNLTESGRRRSS